MSEKDSDHHDDDDDKQRILLRRLLVVILTLTFIILFITFFIWIILRPTKPHFILQDITIFAFNVSSPYLLTSTLQVTLSSENPNDRIGIYYDHLYVYLSYRDQQVTLPTLLPPSYQGNNDMTVWSPFLYGDSVPIAPSFGYDLYEDEIAAGSVLVHVRVNGRIRFKVGTFISGTYHLHVSCSAYISLVNNAGIPVGPVMKFQLLQNCQVDV